eukprot:9188980-Alexandrium_andersonii.AAC.1
MSASLVGSEMCIRDRPPHSLRSARALVHCGWPRSWRYPSGVNGGVSGPVSYTHLTLPTICSV